MEPRYPPLVPLALGLAAGLVLAGGPWATLLAGPLLAASAWDRGHRPAWLGLLLGLLLGTLAGADARPHPLTAALTEPVVLEVEGEVREASLAGGRGAWLLVDLERVGGRGARGLVARLHLASGTDPGCGPGDRILAAARLRAPAPARNPGARRGARASLAGWVAERPVVLERGRGARAAVAVWRRAAAAALDRRLRPRDAGLARALVLGDRSALDDRDRSRFRHTGQGHLVAVSGLHVGLLLASVLFALRWLGVPLRIRAALGLVLVLLYVPFAGARPSVVRAGFGAALYFAGRLLGRAASPANVLAAVVVGVLVLEPRGIGDAALTLSVSAVLGILLLARRIEAVLVPPRPVVPGVIERRRAWLRRALSVSLAAWLGTAPLLATFFGRLAPLAAPLAVVAVPLTAVLVGIAFLLLLLPLPFLAPPAAALFEAAAALLRILLDLVVEAGLGTLPVARPTPGWVLLYVPACLLAAFAGGRLTARALLPPLALLAVLFLPPSPAPPPWPRVVLLDVGHGQAAVLLTPDRRVALLDAGRLGDPRVGRRRIVPALRALGVGRVDLAVLSHADADHASGLADVHAEIGVDLLVLPPRPGLADRPAPGESARRVRPAREGETLLEGDWGALRLLAPGRPPPPDDNEAGLVLLLETAAGRRLLLPGDLGGAGAQALLTGPVPARVDVLVLPHHGLPGPGRDLLLAAWPDAERLASCGRAALAALPPGSRATASHGALLVDLEPCGAVVRAPWRDTGRGYDPRAPMPAPLLAVRPLDATTLVVAAVLLVFALVSARPMRWLTAPGATGAFVLGVTAWLAFGAAGLAALVAPFLVANLLGRLPGAKPSEARSLRQVVANGLPALVGAGLALAGEAAAGWAFFLGALAGQGADTSATEVGTRYGGEPRSVVTGRRMPRGESGGVTLAGLLASVGGGALAPLAAWPFGGLDARGVGLATFAGVAAGLLDSVLGATLQYRGRDAATGRPTERRLTDAGPTERLRGLPWLDNDAVNLAAGFAAAAIALALLR